MLDREAIFEAFRALDHELAARDIRANVFVVGAAAMAIAYDTRRSTADVDAAFAPRYAIPPRTRFMLEEMFPTRPIEEEPG